MTAARGQRGGLVTLAKMWRGCDTLSCLLSLWPFGGAGLTMKLPTSWSYLLHFLSYNGASIPSPRPLPCGPMPTWSSWLILLWAQMAVHSCWGSLWDSHCAPLFPTSHIPHPQCQRVREKEYSFTCHRDFRDPLRQRLGRQVKTPQNCNQKTLVWISLYLPGKLCQLEYVSYLLCISVLWPITKRE